MLERFFRISDEPPKTPKTSTDQNPSNLDTIPPSTPSDQPPVFKSDPRQPPATSLSVASIPHPTCLLPPVPDSAPSALPRPPLPSSTSLQIPSGPRPIPVPSLYPRLPTSLPSRRLHSAVLPCLICSPPTQPPDFQAAQDNSRSPSSPRCRPPCPSRPSPPAVLHCPICRPTTPNLSTSLQISKRPKTFPCPLPLPRCRPPCPSARLLSPFSVVPSAVRPPCQSRPGSKVSKRPKTIPVPLYVADILAISPSPPVVSSPAVNPDRQIQSDPRRFTCPDPLPLFRQSAPGRLPFALCRLNHRPASADQDNSRASPGSLPSLPFLPPACFRSFTTVSRFERAKTTRHHARSDVRSMPRPTQHATPRGQAFERRAGVVGYRDDPLMDHLHRQTRTRRTV